ncbi:hypothetical protein AB0M12_04915 [Nocardia vinacea]
MTEQSTEQESRKRADDCLELLAAPTNQRGRCGLPGSFLGPSD